MRYIVSRLAVVLALLLPTAEGRAQEGQSTQPSIAAVEAYIVNDGSVEVLFYLSVDADNWDEYKLKPGYQNTYTGGDALFIRINTNNGPRVQYRLEYKKRYRIFWNNVRSCWDVQEISSR